jgi:cellobiose-specific phosphotransferase system component IIA
MRIVPFPTGHDDEGAEQAWLAELESALSGAAQGPAADSWRELRDDVRSLAPAMSAGFERQLRERIPERDAARRRRKLRLSRPGRPAIAAAFSVALVVLVALVIVGPWRSGHATQALPALSHAQTASQPFASERLGGSGSVALPRSGVKGPSRPASSSGAASSASADEEAAPSSNGAAAPSSSGPASAPGRVQELGASVTLAVTPASVQETADRVSRLVVRDGGFVQSSHVQVQQGHDGEANLTLKLPSEKLSAALASLEQIAPVRDESQSLQDITNSYDAARQRLTDANAERQALLHALANASTEGQIDSLRERLAQSRSAIANAHSALEAVSRRARTAEVEVSVLGDAHAGDEGLTLHRGLHDAGRVLTITLVVLLIAAAALVPLALLALGLTAAGRVWRRRRREQVLGAS